MSIGVSVTTEAISGRSSANSTPSATVFATGLTERGDVDSPILVRSLADVKALTGSRVTYGALYDQMAVFFAEGGEQAYINRVVGPAATKGTLTLVDRAGSPLSTLRVDAQNPGAWSSNLKVEVRDGTLANTFRILVTLNSGNGDVVVHDETNIPDPATAVTRFAKSPYIRVVNLGSATVAPNNNPAVAAAAALSAGNDDRASITTTHWSTAISRSIVDLGTGAVIAPGQTGDAIFDIIEAHCAATNRIAILAGAETDSIATLQTAAGLRNSEYSGLFAPWLNIDDGFGGIRTISPEGFVAAMRARAHSQVGPWRAPAGAIAVANYVLGVKDGYSYTADQIDTLSASKINVIRTGKAGTRLYGWISTSEDVENWQYLHNRDLINYLVVEGTTRLEEYVFSPIDAKGHTLSQVRASLIGLADPIRAAGGLYERLDAVTGKQVDPGYRVTCDQSNNTLTSLANNEINAELAVRVSPVGGLIRLKITKVGTLGGL